MPRGKKREKSMTEQLKILSDGEVRQSADNEKQNATACVFTGHREIGEDFSARKLRAEIESLIKEGVTTFYDGMAKGFDLVAATVVLRLKNKYPQIRLIACVPCYGQEKYFCERDKKTYAEALKKADEQIVLSPAYYRGCMQARDRYMAERAQVMIAYCKKTEGGAAYTVKIFQKSHPSAKIIFL